MAISRDGAWLAAGKSTPSIYVVHASCVPGGGLILNDDVSEFYGDVFCVVFSRDRSKLAAAGADGTAKIWRLSDGSLLHILTGHSFISTNEDETIIRPVYCVDFSPDGTLVA